MAVTLHHLDQAWVEHLALCADLREGIHLVRLGQQDPLTRFTAEVVDAYERLEPGIDEAVRVALDAVRVVDDRLDLAPAGVEVKGPAATWTYLVNDDPFPRPDRPVAHGPRTRQHRHLLRAVADAADDHVGPGGPLPAAASAAAGRSV